jgi:hypothetical protein
VRTQPYFTLEGRVIPVPTKEQRSEARRIVVDALVAEAKKCPLADLDAEKLRTGFKGYENMDDAELCTQFSALMLRAFEPTPEGFCEALELLHPQRI